MISGSVDCVGWGWNILTRWFERLPVYHPRLVEMISIWLCFQWGPLPMSASHTFRVLQGILQKRSGMGPISFGVPGISFQFTKTGGPQNDASEKAAPFRYGHFCMFDFREGRWVDTFPFLGEFFFSRALWRQNLVIRGDALNTFGI